MARIVRCKRIRAGNEDVLISGIYNNVYDMTTGKVLAGNIILQHEFVAPPPPLKEENPMPKTDKKYKEWAEKHGQERLL